MSFSDYYNVFKTVNIHVRGVVIDIPWQHGWYRKQWSTGMKLQACPANNWLIWVPFVDSGEYCQLPRDHSSDKLLGAVGCTGIKKILSAVIDTHTKAMQNGHTK